MLFNSIEFVLFFLVFYITYSTVLNKSVFWQNVLILLASYVFYAFWDWRFLGLIIFSTWVDYIVGHRLSITESSSARKKLLYISILVNLGMLAFFKYFNFFQDSFIDLLSIVGLQAHPWSLTILLPVGISFYTFQSMSYTIDVYHRRLQPNESFITFAAFVSFFPQLVAGPIERATNLIPQFTRARVVTRDGIAAGIQLCILGFFKKIVIADSIAPIVNRIFSNHHDLSSITLLLGAIYFGIQIYADFSGYSNIARGLARMMGFRLMVNFDLPYFSRNVGEFWRRWHISLSTWFRDYLYIPLGGSRGGSLLSIRNIFIIFLVSGFWHGANWTFLAWGAYHAFLFVPLFLMGRNRLFLTSKSSTDFSSLIRIMGTFFLINLGWVFFRAESLSHAISYFNGIFSFSSFEITSQFGLVLVLFTLLVDLVITWRKDNRLFYFILLGGILAGTLTTTPAEFIYFQF